MSKVESEMDCPTPCSTDSESEMMGVVLITSAFITPAGVLAWRVDARGGWGWVLR